MIFTNLYNAVANATQTEWLLLFILITLINISGQLKKIISQN